MLNTFNPTSGDALPLLFQIEAEEPMDSPTLLFQIEAEEPVDSPMLASNALHMMEAEEQLDVPTMTSAPALIDATSLFAF